MTGSSVVLSKAYKMIGFIYSCDKDKITAEKKLNHVGRIGGDPRGARAYGR